MCKNWAEHHACKRDYIWNPATCICEKGRYPRSIIDDSVMCDEIIEETKTLPTKSTSKKAVTTINKKGNL